eukprot:Plantae.Rhodophyta-Purpureofilum_apyrenoidigerum.ctg12022.p1 GENE.Plantae.Rhodophyta-Purpureofilum_apyrenoidigerum.ctg12022~~Plantae.Rhodophyta-Purpureofilum_apyrenoidigerum.ctg12022.p1  ORF type:complete len:712 (-),score=153.91 Plantae.Rhodophyta-Purpureofilum_apyrenoidigerum.ctg12022:643-2778(-)
MEVGERKLCFDRNELKNADVSISDFVAEIRTKAPLATLRDDLRHFLDEVSGELIAQIQSNFAAFMSLGSAVADADHLADTILLPLEDLHKDVDTISDSFDREIVRLAKTLDKRRQLANRRNLLELFLRISDLVHKCERLLKEVEKCENCVERHRILERTASESAQLEFCLGRVDQQSQFIESLKPRLVKLKENVRDGLSVWMKEVLREDQNSLVSVLAAYSSAGMVEDAEKLFRKEVVAPFVSLRLKMSSCNAVAEKKLTSENDVITAANSLEAAKEFIETFMKERCEKIVSVCYTEERLRAYDFVTNAIWPEIEEGIANNLSSVFSPGIADTFHRCYCLALEIYGLMERNCLNEERLDRLHNCSASADFWRRWSLPIYFQLRFQEITAVFETALADKPKMPPKTEGTENESNATSRTFRLLSYDVYQLESTRALVKCLRRCWEDDVYLKPLTHRLLKLSLQLMSRYTTWIRTGLQGQWGSDTSIKELAAVFSDVELLVERLGAELASMLRMGAMSSLDSAITSGADNAFDNAVGSTKTVLSEVGASLSGKLSKSCMDALQPLRGIPATYRVINRPAPTEHSRFIPNVLKPLRQFLSDAEVKISESERKVIVKQVVDATAVRYHEMASDLISSIRETADALRRLKIGDSNARSVGSNAEVDKITMQLYLDVRKFGSDVNALGVSTDDIPGFQKLWQCVDVEQSSKNAMDAK